MTTNVKQTNKTTAEEQDIVDFYMEKYNTQNPISKMLIFGFYFALKRLFLRIKPEDRQKVIEVACGPGESTHRIAKFADIPEFHASDVDQELVDVTKLLVPNVKTLVESIYDLKHKDSSFDVVFALEVLEHLEDPLKALDEIHRITSKYAIISVPNEPLFRIGNMVRGSYWSTWGNMEGHINHWGPFGFRKMISRKFKIKASSLTPPWQIYLCEKK
jgi:ubiquinone/menaquinone biosynthesis C-methylase UbiE